MGIDQAHKQNNKLIKIDGGATDLLNDNAALFNWTVAGAEFTEMVPSGGSENITSSLRH